MSDILPIPPTTKQWDAARGRILVEAWRASGLTGTAFCREQNVRPQRLHYWRQRLGYAMRVLKDNGQLLSPKAPTTNGFVEVVVGDSGQTATTYVDIVVGGAIIRVRPGFDPKFLRSIVTALGIEPVAC